MSEKCRECDKRIFDEDGQSYGHSDREGWLCPDCYEPDKFTADLTNDGWTHIVEGDPTTLPTDSMPVLAAWVYMRNTNERRVYISQCDDGEWYNQKQTEHEQRVSWRVYAWREWPQAPVLLLTEED